MVPNAHASSCLLWPLARIDLATRPVKSNLPQVGFQRVSVPLAAGGTPLFLLSYPQLMQLQLGQAGQPQPRQFCGDAASSSL